MKREKGGVKISVFLPSIKYLRCNLASGPHLRFLDLTVFPFVLISLFRFEAIGTRLIFSDDNDPGWGPGE